MTGKGDAMLYILEGPLAQRRHIQDTLAHRHGTILVSEALMRDVDRLLDCGARLMIHAEQVPDATWAQLRGGRRVQSLADIGG